MAQQISLMVRSTFDGLRSAFTGMWTATFGLLYSSQHPEAPDHKHVGSRHDKYSIDRKTSCKTSMPEVDAYEGYNNLIDWTFSGSYDEDRPVLIDASNPARYISGRKALNLVARLAGCFEEGSTVCLHLPNDVLYPVLVLGIFASKCRWTGSHSAYTHHELEHHFRSSETKYVITISEHVATVQKAVETGLDYTPEVILFTDLLSEERANTDPVVGENRLRTLHDLAQDSDYTRLRKHLEATSLNDVVALSSTSGTTGLPKMAARTARAMMQETKVIEDNNSAKPYEVRRLFCTPIFHSFSAPMMIFNPLRLGCSTYIMKKFDETFAQKLYDFGITETAAPPPILARLAQQKDSWPLLQSLKLIFTGGAPLVPERRMRTLNMFNPKPRIVPVWGMTEGGWFSTIKYPEDDDTNSVGRPIPGFDIKVCEHSSITLADGRLAGELLVRGPQVMTGYLNNAAATEDAFTIDGWLKTGDIGYFENGKIHLVDRAKDLIKVNGWQVAPAELESALLASPDIVDAAAIGTGSGVEERPMVFVVCRDGAQKCEAEVEKHLRERLARYKIAHVKVEFVEAIPRNPSGKILRKVLRAVADAREIIEKGP